MLRNIIISLALLGLAACSTTPNPLEPSKREALFVKDATIKWSFDDAKSQDNQVYLDGKADMVARLEQVVEQEFKNSPAGSQPVTFEIDVTRYSRVGAAMGNIIGGSNAVFATVRVIGADGTALGEYKDVVGVYASNGGVIGAIAQAATKPDIVGIMAIGFAQNLRRRFEAK